MFSLREIDKSVSQTASRACARKRITTYRSVKSRNSWFGFGSQSGDEVILSLRLFSRRYRYQMTNRSRRPKAITAVEVASPGL